MKRLAIQTQYYSKGKNPLDFTSVYHRQNTLKKEPISLPTQTIIKYIMYTLKTANYSILFTDDVSERKDYALIEKLIKRNPATNFEIIQGVHSFKPEDMHNLFYRINVPTLNPESYKLSYPDTELELEKFEEVLRHPRTNIQIPLLGQDVNEIVDIVKLCYLVGKPVMLYIPNLPNLRELRQSPYDKLSMEWLMEVLITVDNHECASKDIYLNNFTNCLMGGLGLSNIVLDNRVSFDEILTPNGVKKYKDYYSTSWESKVECRTCPMSNRSCNRIPIMIGGKQ